MWKRREACSKAVLIGRGLDQAKVGFRKQGSFIVRFWGCVERHAPLAQLVEQLTLNQRVPGSSPCWCTKNRLFGGGFLKAAPKRLICSEDSRKDTSRLETQNTVSCSSRCFGVLLLFLTALFWNHQNFSGNNIRQNSTQNIEQKGHAATSLRLQFEKAACPEYHFKEKIVNM